MNAIYVTQAAMRTVLINDVDMHVPKQKKKKKQVLWRLYPAPVTRRAFWNNLLRQGIGRHFLLPTDTAVERATYRLGR